MSYLQKGSKRTKLTEKIAVDFFLLKEFYLDYKVLPFSHSIYSIISFYKVLPFPHSIDSIIIFLSQSKSSVYAVKKAEVPSSYCVE